MRSVRLLPIVIFAALALLLFKGLGLVTNGGYVLSGSVIAAANEGAEESASLPSEAVLTDTSPTLGDVAPTIAGSRSDSSSAPGEHGASDASSAPADASASGDHGNSSEASTGAPSSAAEVPDIACTESPRSAPTATGTELTDHIGNALAVGCPAPAAPTNEFGDALPTTKDANGKIVPLAIAEGDDSEKAILQRLAGRRAELDNIAADLAMRQALIEAAEKRLDERAKALEALEAQVNALVDEKQVTEDAGFKAVVSMYETMKPKEAAAIFNTLDVDVLLRVVRAMNPRKMSPILAAMGTKPAEALTTALASKGPGNIVADAGNVSNLPQIVGK